MKRDRDSVPVLNRIMCALLFAALVFVFWLAAETARASAPTETIPSPFDGMRDIVIDFDRDCVGGMCSILRDDLVAVARANVALQARLAKEIADKTKRCAKVTEEKGPR